MKLTLKQEQEAIKAYKLNGAITQRNAVVLSQVGFINKEASKLTQDEVFHQDLVQEGFATALHAIEKYDIDSENGTAFRSYCGFAVRNAMYQMLARSTTQFSIKCNLAKYSYEKNRRDQIDIADYDVEDYHPNPEETLIDAEIKDIARRLFK